MYLIKILIFFFQNFRFQTLVNGAKKYDVDGLSSLKYQVHYLEKKPLYTWLIVEIKEDSVKI